MIIYHYHGRKEIILDRGNITEHVLYCLEEPAVGKVRSDKLLNRNIVIIKINYPVVLSY